MALVLADRVQQTGTANTTVSFTLTGSVSGFQSFAVIGNTNTTYYAATDTSGNWEAGLGTYSTTGPTLTRTTIYSSSNSNLAVTFSGTVTVFVTYPSSRSVYEDASGNVSPLGTIASGTWQGTTIGVAYGGTGVTTSSGANSVVLRDSNQNITVNRLNQSSTTVTAAAGITTLTAASTFSQILNGTGGQTFKLPDATTLTNTTTFEFNNNATGTLTITDNASATVGTVAPGGAANIALLSNATVGGTWDVHAYIPENVTWGTNALALGSTVITGGAWNGGTIQSGYGGTGLTTFTGANNALYSTSASALAAGTLPVAAGGTGITTLATNRIPYGNGTGAFQSSANLTFDGTTLTANTLSVTNSVTISGGTANGVLYLNGSKVATSGSALTFDGTNFATTGQGTFRSLVLNGVGTSQLSTTDASGLYIDANTNGGMYLQSGNNFIFRASAAGSYAEYMRLTSTGLGIGTSSPSYKLQLSGTGTGAYLRITNTTASTGDATILRALDTGESYLSSAGAYPLLFGTSNTERMRLDSSGNLGIGTSSPGAKLDVSGSNAGSVLQSRVLNTSTSASSDAQHFIYVNGATAGDAYTTWTVGGVTSWSGGVRNSDSDSWYLSPGSSLGTTPVITATTAGNVGIGTTSPNLKLSVNGGVRTVSNSYMLGQGFGIYGNNDSANYIIQGDATSGGTLIYNWYGGHIFQTSGGSERMRIDSSGNLLVGTTSAISGYLFRVNGQGAFAGPSSDVDGNSGVRIDYGNSAGTVLRFLALNANGSTNAAIGLNMVDSSNGSMVFSTRGSNSLAERVRITSAGTLQLSSNYQEGVVTANTTTAYTISLASGTVQILTLTGNCTFTFPTATSGQSFTLLLKQDATGGRTVTWPASVKWPSSTAPTITSTATKLDKYVFISDGANWYGSTAGQNY